MYEEKLIVRTLRISPSVLHFDPSSLLVRKRHHSRRDQVLPNVLQSPARHPAQSPRLLRANGGHAWREMGSGWDGVAFERGRDQGEEPCYWCGGRDVEGNWVDECDGTGGICAFDAFFSSAED